jgi:hypothetical protein
MGRLDVLKAELAAIDRLDHFYWRTENPQRHEKLGYLVRQDRRRDLITELLKLLHNAENSEAIRRLLTYNFPLPLERGSRS